MEVMALSPDLASCVLMAHDAVHASELSLDRAADAQILSTAVDLGPVVITADLDFPELPAAALDRWSWSGISAAATTANRRARDAFAAS